MGVKKAHQVLKQVVGVNAGAHAHPQPAATSPILGVDLLLERLPALRHLLGVLTELLAQFRGEDALGRPGEQVVAQFRLQIFDLQRQRGLGDEQIVRRFGKVMAPRHFQRVEYLHDGHSSASRVYIFLIAVF